MIVMPWGNITIPGNQTRNHDDAERAALVVHGLVVFRGGLQQHHEPQDQNHDRQRNCDEEDRTPPIVPQ